MGHAVIPQAEAWVVSVLPPDYAFGCVFKLVCVCVCLCECVYGCVIVCV